MQEDRIMSKDKRKLETERATIYQTNENCQVFTGPVSGCVFAMPGATVQQFLSTDAKGKVDEVREKPVENQQPLLRVGIFHARLFDSVERLEQLRATIARSIDLGEQGRALVEPHASLVDAKVQGEWYYVMKAIEEAEVAKKFTTPEFVEQMLEWFSWLCEAETSEDREAQVRRICKSISRERNLWKYGKEKEVTALKDMWVRQQVLGIEHAKVERLYNAAYKGLYEDLAALKKGI